MAQFNKRKETLDGMRKQLPKRRLDTTYFTRKNNIVEYEYINYDLELVKAEYESIKLSVNCGGWDSNPRASGYEPDDLAASLPRILN